MLIEFFRIVYVFVLAFFFAGLWLAYYEKKDRLKWFIKSVFAGAVYGAIAGGAWVATKWLWF